MEDIGLGIRALLYASPLLLLVLLYLAVLVLPRLSRWMKRKGQVAIGRVLRVESGKHLVVQIGERRMDVYLAYVAVAEDVHDADATAQRLLANLLEGREVRLRVVDRHDGALIVQMLQPLDAAAELIAKGLCYARTDAPPDYQELQNAAIRGGTGLWKAVTDQERKSGTAWYEKP